jgi:hypothetical protein
VSRASVTSWKWWPAYDAAQARITTTNAVNTESQRTAAKSSNQVVSARLTPPASAFANRCTNMSMNALALYFSSRVVGPYNASFADWLIE